MAEFFEKPVFHDHGDTPGSLLMGSKPSFWLSAVFLP